jgi:GMP synthase-like glutamine amidotransferase
MSFTIGILECDRPDSPELIAGARGETYGAMYHRMLTTADPSIDTRIYDAVGGHLPGRADECDAWIITGARYDAYRNELWLIELRRFVAEVAERGVRTVGVCFGHQLIAHALGGHAEPSGEWCAGPMTMTMDETPWFAGGRATIHAMHQDVVTRMPAGARVIASGATADVPAYLVDDTILGIQDHPEYTADYIAALVASRRDRLGDELTDDALDRIATVPTDGELVGRWIVDFLLDRRQDASTSGFGA